MFRVRNIAVTVSVVFAVLWSTADAGAAQNALAIFNLTPTNMEAMGYDGEILYALISALERQKTIELMSRRDMEEVLFQAGLVQGGDTTSVAKAGKALGINFILFGSVTKKAGRILATLKLMDVENKRLIKTWNKSFTGREDILNEVPKFAGELTSTISNREGSYAVPAAAAARVEVKIDNLRAKSQGKKVLLTWKFDPSQPIVGFNVYRSENSEGPYQYQGKTDQNLFEDARIKKGKSYYYRVGLKLSSGKEIKSSLTTQIKSAGEKIPHPPLVMGGKGYIRRTEIKFVPSLMNEQERFKIKAYKVFRKKSSDSSWKIISSVSAKMTSQSELAFKVEDNKGLEDGEAYFYAVVSLDNKKRESPMSDPVIVKTIDRPVLKVEQDNLLRKIKVAWEPQENIAGHYLYRRQGQKDWSKVAKTRAPAKPGFTDKKDLEDGQTYQYQLTAYDAKGESGPSNTIQTKTKDLPPFPQDVITQSSLVKSVKIFWTPVEDADVGGYFVYRGTGTENLKRITKVKGYKSNSFLDKGRGFAPLKDGQDYFYAIVSYNLFGADGKSTKAVKATTKPRPTPVQGLVATKGADYIQIKWDKNPQNDIKTYILSRSRNNGYWSNLEKLTADKNIFKDVDLKPKSNYRYQIIALDKDSLKSDPVESENVASPVVKPKK
jgi:fibronectin type 3 domain-containing protein/TolB-like protein